jgi:hypothetical protein
MGYQFISVFPGKNFLENFQSKLCLMSMSGNATNVMWIRKIGPRKDSADVA